MRLLRILGLTALLLPAPVRAATFSVTSAADSGPGSLRDAILAANSNLTADEIDFAIPGSGVHTIVLASALPTITEPVTINGYSQPGSSANTLPTGQGLDTVLTIEIDGSAVGGGAPCLSVAAGNDKVLAMIIQGLVINRCPDEAIYVGAGGDGTLIIGNFIGTDPSGQSRPGTQAYGIVVENAPAVEVGGTFPSLRNLVAGFSNQAIRLVTANSASIRGNLIGTDVDGVTAIGGLGQFSAGIYVSGSTNVVVGGLTAAAQNVISGLGGGISVGGSASEVLVQRNRIGTDVAGTSVLGNGSGVFVNTTSVVTLRQNVISGNETGVFAGLGPIMAIQGNFIGTDETATLDLGNRSAGLLFGSSSTIQIGGTGPEGNVIAHNGSPISSGALGIGGILIAGSNTVANIRANRIFDNAPLGIDLTGDGVTPNDPFDSDTGENLLQNYPLITSVVAGVSTTHVEGVLDTTPSMEFEIDVFSDSICKPRPQAYDQGETYLGSVHVQTDGLGHASFGIDFPVVLEPGQPVTATATDGNGRTSEFSQRILFSLDPPSGPAAGGVAPTLNGMLFEPGAEVSVAGLPATNVVVVGPNAITVTMPARPAGSLSDVTVLNPSGTRGTLRNGWLADFNDVPAGHPFHDYVVAIAAGGVTAGTGGGAFGLNASTLRQQMAVFLLKGKHGVCYVPPPCQHAFTDVACPSTFADWIEALFAEGITGGCGTGLFCPNTPVRRDQMAVFLLKAEHGSDYVPPDCAGEFDDVPCPSTFAAWVEQLAAEGVTSGCGGDNYCPGNPNTRGQMAVFLTRVFGLP